MPGERSLEEVIHNLLSYGDLTFHDFVELALYHPQFGYYARARNPIGTEGDYITAPSLSPAFSFAVTRLMREFMSRCEGAVSSFVDIGCGDGSLVRSIADQIEGVLCFGVDRALDRVPEEGRVSFARSIDEVQDSGCRLTFSNELFDAIPFARLVRRGEHLHELWVTEREGGLDWQEHEAPPPYEDYFEERGIQLAEGQFADVTFEWGRLYEDLARSFERGLIVTVDYGFAQQKLFDSRIRRFGTAASYSGHRVARDLLARPGQQDLTAHINFSDLERAGERNGLRTLYFGSLAKFLLGIGITEHELFRSIEDVDGALGVQEGLALFDARDAARRLVLPDGIGEDLRVLVQEKGMGGEKWSFERKLY